MPWQRPPGWIRSSSPPRPRQVRRPTSCLLREQSVGNRRHHARQRGSGPGSRPVWERCAISSSGLRCHGRHGAGRSTTSQTDSLGLARAVWTMGANRGYDTLSATVSGVTRPILEPRRTLHLRLIQWGWASRTRVASDGTGQTSCWGLNFAGEVGSGDTSSAFTPQVLAGAPLFRTITAGGAHGCGLTAQSQLYCWGTLQARLGLAPTLQPFPQAFASVGSGRNFLCGLTAGGQAFCWGDNAEGQLGNGTTASSSAPVPVSGGARYRQIGGGLSHACGLTSGRQARCGEVGRAVRAARDPIPSARCAS